MIRRENARSAVMTDPNMTDEALLDAARAGDEAALEALLERNWNAAFHIALTFVRDRSLAEDVAQEACLGLIKAAEGPVVVEDFAPWFRGLVANKARTALRSDSRRRAREEKAARVEGVDDPRRADLREWTRALPQRLRQPLELHFGLGLTHAEVARTLDCPKGTVATWIREGLGRLKKSFAAQGVSLSLAAISELAGASLAEAFSAGSAPARPGLAALRRAGGKAAGGIGAGAAWGLLGVLFLGAALGLTLTLRSPAAPAPSGPTLAAAAPAPRGLVLGPNGALYRKRRIKKGRRRMTRYVPVNGQGPMLKETAAGLVPVQPAGPAGGKTSGQAAPASAAEPGAAALVKEPAAPAREALRHEGVSQLLVDGEGRRLVSVGRRNARIWDLKTGRRLFETPAWGALFLDGGRRLGTIDNRHLSLWDLSGEEVRLERKVPVAEEGNALVPKIIGAWRGGVVIRRSVLESPSLVDLASGERRSFGPGFNTKDAALSPDGVRVVSFEINYRPGEPGKAPAGRPIPEGCERFVLVVWNALSEEVEHLMPATREGFMDDLKSFAFDRGGARMFTIGGYRLRRWDLVRGEEDPLMKRLDVKGEAGLSSLCLAGDGALVIGDGAGTIRVLDRESFAERAVFEAHGGGVAALAVLPGGRSLVSGGEDGRIRFWELDALPRPKLEGSGHESPVADLSFAADGARLLSRDEQGLAVLRAADGSALARFEAVESARFQEGGALVLRRNPVAKVAYERVDARMGRSLGALSFEAPLGLQMDWALSGTGRLALAGRPNMVVDIASGERVLALPEGSEIGLKASLSRSGRLAAWLSFAEADSKTQRIAVWDLDAGARRLSIEARVEADEIGSVTRLEVLPDQGVVLAFWKSRVQAWSLVDGAELWVSEGLRPYATSPDGARLAAAKRAGASWAPVLLETASGRELEALAPLKEAPTAMAIAPGGRRLALGFGDGRVELRDRAPRGAVSEKK